MVLTFEDYLLLWAIFLFAIRKMPVVLYSFGGKGEVQDAWKKLVGVGRGSG